MGAYYNENDPYAAAWLRNLITAGLIADGEVDERSIADVRPGDLRGFTQCHFFAGIGGWSHAFRLAGWADDRPAWTGSCPCQPFSGAGKRRGTADARHMWPEFHRLIAECRPDVVFGEQVASADGRAWLGGQPGLQRLQDREAVLRVLSERNLIGGIPDALQGLLSIGRERAESEDAEGKAEQRLQEVASAEPWCRAGKVGGLPGEGEGPALHDQPSGDPVEDRRGRVSDDRDTVQFGWWSDMGQPVDRSDRQLEGVHAGEYEGRPLLHQRHGKHMGRKQDRRDRGGDHGPTAQPVSRIAGTTGSIIEAASRFPELAGVRADLEAVGYAVGAADLCAAGVGAPHIRQRLWWVGIADGPRSQPGEQAAAAVGYGRAAVAAGNAGTMADAWGDRRGERAGTSGGNGRQQPRTEPGGRGAVGGCGDGFWSDATWLPCTDGKARRVEPGIQPLAYGVFARVGKLRAAGNAIVPQVAAEFIGAFMGVTN